MAKFLIILSSLAVCSLAQRPYYLQRPVGYPEIVPTTHSPPQIPQQQFIVDSLGNRFDDANAEPTTKTYIPIQFQSDPEAFYNFLDLPMDQRPFNVINAAQIQEAMSKPQTYPLKPNHYALNQALMDNIQ